MNVTELQRQASQAEPAPAVASSQARREGLTGVAVFDNLHVLLWLIKDTCWLLEWRGLGTFMVLPTIAVAVILAIRSRANHIFWINLAICFWITANSYWMLCEFFEREEIKNYAGIPFACGFIAVAVFYLKPAPKDD